ncbi:TYE7 [[Candida] subhashii]|uniref:TYE7 n=1 Tax=[Candida] subhashii TaxID=561895 RepID=A0A8J5QF47_9ASCO|nr:TYE7 [[Candida] subhashii]KAG7660682.1 TYE7 [[Candida] subhashii]
MSSLNNKNYQPNNFNINYGLMEATYTAPLMQVQSNVSDNVNEWMTDFIVHSAPVTTINSPSGTHAMLAPPQHLSQPINFSQYFDDDAIFSQPESANSSKQTSITNSPSNFGVATNGNVYNTPASNAVVNDVILPNLAEANMKLSQRENLNLETLETIFDTKDILKTEPVDVKIKLNNTPQSYLTTPVMSPSISNAEATPLSGNSSVASSTNTSPTRGNGKTPTGKPKRRAPRKKLTEVQKKAHNKIEKRYRININAKIAGIQKIIPWVALEKTAFETGEKTDEADNGCARLNKSMILEKATDYILYLQEREKQIMDENEILKQKVISLGGSI